MRTAKLTELKNHLSRFIDQARRGERVRILVRGVPVADLVPVEASPTGDHEEDAWLGSLEADGIIRRGPGLLADELWEPVVPEISGAPLSRTVVEEREAGW